MEALQVFSFKIKSIIHDYEVKFINNIEQSIKDEAHPGDIIIIDKKISDLYQGLTKNLPHNNIIISIDALEKNKSYEGLIPIINKLVSKGFRKNNRLIAIGGGITQDITAFISSIMYRGVGWIFYPTTLLAQGDSCIGSKTSINFGAYKNQVGGFYPPNKIFINTQILRTLSQEDLQSGFGEMSHYFVVAGKSKFFDYVQKYKEAKKNEQVLAELIYKSLMIKKKYIEKDEFDENERQIFNYGHSFGHAIESLTNYSVPHGIAVSFGMDMANFVSVKMGLLDSKIRIEIRNFLQQIWDGFSIKQIDSNSFCNVLAKDKKNVGDELRLILCKGYGKVFKAPVKNDSTLKNWIVEYFNDEL